LTNVAKHARASHVEISVAAADERLSIVIADDGCGFDAELQTGGFGLTGMRERVLVFGGELSIDSLSSGTTVSAWLPLNKRPALPLSATNGPST
jgi:signal transduction histidine kinase